MIEILVWWDEWFCRRLPESLIVDLPNYNHPESICGLLSCALLGQAVHKDHGFQPKVSELLDVSVNLLQFKGRNVYLGSWLEEIFKLRENFSWNSHRHNQQLHKGLRLSQEQLLSLLGKNHNLRRELELIANLDTHFQMLKLADQQPLIQDKNIEQLLTAMETIADLFVKSASPGQNSYWQDRLMLAQTFYQAILHTSQQPHKKLTPTQQEDIYARIVDKKIDVQMRLYSSLHIKNPPEVFLADEEKYLKQLYTFRDEVRQDFDLLVTNPVTTDDKRLLRAEKINAICDKLTYFVCGFLRIIINNAMTILGEKPCAYAVIGLGSLATHSVTPYSDIEFAILLENDSAENILFFAI
jgi:hypothetical protein